MSMTDDEDWLMISIDAQQEWEEAWRKYYDRPTKRPVHKTSVDEMTYQHTNPSGLIHGGELMKRMDTVAGVTAKDYAESDVVTISTAPIKFSVPVEVGDILRFEAEIHEAGYSSMMVHVDVFIEDYLEQERTRTAETYYAFVAVDDEGESVPVPRLDLKTEEERDRERRARTAKEYVKEMVHELYDVS